MELIFFLSRFLTSAEKNHWAIELQIAEFASVIQKTRNLVEFSREQIIIQSDHSSIIGIMQQSAIISTASKMQINVRLIKAFQFLCGFYLSVWYKFRIKHVVPDLLSRLVNANANFPEDPNHSKLGV